jgi:enamine deaminase RidA (YjgF/YER057c/UK114 family)
MNHRSRVPASRTWGHVVGYSRAIRVGNVVEVSGTSATRADGSVVAPNDAYGQTKHILREIAEALHALGATVQDVTRTRVFLTDMS